MSSSSQLGNLSTSSVDDILISASGTGVSSDTISITSGSGIYSYNSTYDFSSIGTINSSGTYTITTTLPTDTITIDTSQFTFNFPEEWINAFPDWSRVQDMCEKYPGLKIAFDNFKVFYEMVKDDYDNPTPKK